LTAGTPSCGLVERFALEFAEIAEESRRYKRQIIT